MSNVKDENYTVIQGFMISELNLKGNELLIYAIIYGFSQLEGQEFNGTLQYLADWCNSTKQGVIKCLNSLIEKGLIEKQEAILNNVKFISYHTTKFNTIKQSLTGIKQSLMGGVKQSLTNDNINNNNINNNISKENIYIKEKYGQYGRVKLTLDEYNRLVKEFNKEFIDNIINALDEYVESNNNKNKYTNYNLVIRKAIRENWFKIDNQTSADDNAGFEVL